MEQTVSKHPLDPVRGDERDTSIDRPLTLAIMSDLVQTVARRDPFCTADRRTVTRTVGDPEQEDLALQVIASYQPRAELMCFYGNVQAARTIQGKRPIVLVYRAWREGEAYILTEAQALELLATGKLPVPARQPQELTVSAGQPADPFAGLGR